MASHSQNAVRIATTSNQVWEHFILVHFLTWSPHDEIAKKKKKIVLKKGLKWV